MGAPGLHYYTLNLEKVGDRACSLVWGWRHAMPHLTVEILTTLGLTRSQVTFGILSNLGLNKLPAE